MKRIIIVISLLALVLGAGAQDMNDALRYSENNYYGTARSIAMGNAFTALGGDLGSIGINPAGSAVNSFSQFTITPGLTYNIMDATYFGDVNQSSGTNTPRRTNGTLPNIGFNIHYGTGRNYGIKSMSFGMTVNTTSFYNEKIEAYGHNHTNSMLGDFAAATDGIHSSQLNGNSAFNNPDIPWTSAIAWQSGMISTYGGNDDRYIGATEAIYDDNTIGLSRTLDQNYGRKSSGSKQDMLFNFGMNISDRIYLGANIGIVTFSYDSRSVMKEMADLSAEGDDPLLNGIEYDNGDIVYFRDARFRQTLIANGTGAYAKIGVIALPFDFLRIGATIQTPTATTIDERWQYAGDISFDNSKYNGSSISPEGNYQYSLKSPAIFNVGAALTIPGLGLISADYETTDYSTMRLKDINGYTDEFYGANSDIMEFTGRVHKLRLGGEVTLNPAVALRAGYNLSTSPYMDENGNSIDAVTKAVSFGVGYSSSGSFFFDLACRGTFKPTEYIYPYGTDIVPEIVVDRHQIWDVVATFGWRF